MPPALADLRAAIRRDHRLDEPLALEQLLALQPAQSSAARITAKARELARRVRSAPPAPLSAESFLRQYGLSTPEGVSLMCVAEALLRIPDAETQDALLREKLASGHWSSASAADWALLLTGTLMQWHDDPSTLKHLLARLGEPVVRGAVRQAMRILAGQFVVAQAATEASARAETLRPLTFSFDMLGEAARTRADAVKYLDSYLTMIGEARAPDAVSIKLSALHPRFEEAKRARVFEELLPLLRILAETAARKGIGLTIDAEESERLELTLDLFEALAGAFPVGLAVQAYQKRALAVCDFLVSLARGKKARVAVRLVKGAYWDSEVKRAQQLGMPGYPVFTQKAATDLSYLACAERLLAAPEAIFPAFATHNCRTVAALLELAGGAEFEFQKLFGMGDALYQTLLAERPAARVRVYAPVGRFSDLLPYLVRRLLENGANTSFVHQIADPNVPIDELVADPAQCLAGKSKIPLPVDLYPDRRNSLGLDLSRRDVLDFLQENTLADRAAAATVPAVDEPLEKAISKATQAFESWSRTPAAERAAALERAADAFEASMADFVSLIVREGGRTYADAVSEVREAIDFCRYYALEARRRFGAPLLLPGPAGERNQLSLHGRGVFACISPWNFPLSIFSGQVAAALAAGNAVVAKPAEQTPRIGLVATELMRRSGVPADVLRCVAGDGEVGAALVADLRIAGIAFTGSTETAERIQRALAGRGGPIAPFIAETGGLNALLADSSALPEQVVDDTVVSAFNSAGQRCSAQRILFLEAGSAPRALELLAGAIAELKVGDPALPDTDIGPVIDAQSREALLGHIGRLRASASLIGEAPLEQHLDGHFVAPIAFELALDDLPRTEVFGPVLHVCRYQRLEDVLGWLRATGYGLTLGIHSRLQTFVDRVVREARVGNVYVNRNMIGAVVGTQPFGGEGLSGTGPKAGGPHYLLRFAAERTLTVNTAAIGGVTDLLA
ncbi:MAG TPA: L-glutamate gamma-semialdehyde dehydrogenase [Burkholderiales bacterium]|jgi:RHH-type proline utilization regulon transcriptional repressor/proline dehydrogenase/delta 1-pyrroline-5-carboxylate dehydrogenase|nr:L-glutamate gamma-semialdehyde dehydrogenase [Burkholderiales bacterium]